MTGSFVTSWWFQNGANVWQWVTSIVTVCAWPVVAYTYLHHRCHHCFRPGTVPVPGTTAKVCKRHADEHGHTHPGKRK
ncbi:MAG TPA: hypothetical protein VKQ71_12085 [Acidimicrobiales bacterium]|nr:hypothetical protein [Acidimicrobiales bacterium]